MYGSLIVGSKTSCTIGGWYHGGINMCGSGFGHPKDLANGSKGDSLDGSPPDELPLDESPSCPPFNGWWSKCLGT